MAAKLSSLVFGLFAFWCVGISTAQTATVDGDITVEMPNGVKVHIPKGTPRDQAEEIVLRLHLPEDKYERAEAALKGTGSVYWLELMNIFDEWDRTILVFGYGNNATACEALKGYAELDAPLRQFRCAEGHL